MFFLMTEQTTARECNLSQQWDGLCASLQSRVESQETKMKLRESEAEAFENFTDKLSYHFLYLPALQKLAPKTTIELLMAIYKRGLDKREADKMAKYLTERIDYFNFKNIAAFDNNTSHIIGREWHEIDYSGESMTWQKQKIKYAPYGISNFKSLACLEKFFPVESKLPYFNKIYMPFNKKMG